MASTTSGLLTTPPRPVPGTVAMSIPASVATRRAAGDDFTPSPSTGVAVGVGAAAAGAGAGAGAGVGGGAAAGAGAAAGGAASAFGADAVAPLAVSSNSAIKSPTFTTDPSVATCFEIAPFFGAGTSTVILSVSSSTSVSPDATASPSFLS